MPRCPAAFACAGSAAARAWALVALTLPACGSGAIPGDRTPPATSVDTPAPSTRSAPPSGTRDTASHPKIVFLGDSLTAGLGLREADAYPALLQQKLSAAGYAW